MSHLVINSIVIVSVTLLVSLEKPPKCENFFLSGSAQSSISAKFYPNFRANLVQNFTIFIRINWYLRPKFQIFIRDWRTPLRWLSGVLCHPYTWNKAKAPNLLENSILFVYCPGSVAMQQPLFNTAKDDAQRQQLPLTEKGFFSSNWRHIIPFKFTGWFSLLFAFFSLIYYEDNHSTSDARLAACF